MKKSLFIIAAFAAITFVISIDTARAQRGWYEGSPRDTVNDIERSTDQFKRSLDNALDRSKWNGTRYEDEVNGYVRNFERETDRLKSKWDNQGYAPNQTLKVLNQGKRIDVWMKNHRMVAEAEGEWLIVKRNLDQLARCYRVRWRW